MPKLTDIVNNAFKDVVKLVAGIVASVALLRSRIVVAEFVGSLQLQPTCV